MGHFRRNALEAQVGRVATVELTSRLAEGARRTCTVLLRALGVAVIVEGTVLSAARLVRRGFTGIRSPYREVRQILAGAIVLGT